CASRAAQPRDIAFKAENEIAVLPVVANLAAADEPRFRERAAGESEAPIIGRAGVCLLPRRARMHADVPASPTRRRRDILRRLDRHIARLGTRNSHRREAGGNQKTFLPHGDTPSCSTSSPLHQSASVPSGRMYRQTHLRSMYLKNNTFLSPKRMMCAHHV